MSSAITVFHTILITSILLTLANKVLLNGKLNGKLNQNSKKGSDVSHFFTQTILAGVDRLGSGLSNIPVLSLLLTMSRTLPSVLSSELVSF